MNMLASFWLTMRYSPIPRTAVLVTAATIAIAAVVRFGWRKPSTLRTVVIRSSGMLVSFVYALVLVEAMLYLFYAETHASGGTLASRRWMEKYWHPVNSMGYRDVEPDWSAASHKQFLCVLGDSFVAGQGIRRIEDRFSDILRRSLEPGWFVTNVSQCGWDTRDAQRALERLPIAPDAVVLTYHKNDIESAAAAGGLTKPNLAIHKPEWCRSWINRSHLLNLVYTRLSARISEETGNAYQVYLEQCHDSPAVRAAHEADLTSLIDSCRDRNAKLVVVLFPDLVNVDGDRQFMRQMAEWFAERGVATIDLGAALAGRPPAELIVNRFDAHPNEAVHAQIASLLYPLVTGAAFADATGGSPR